MNWPNQIRNFKAGYQTLSLTLVLIGLLSGCIHFNVGVPSPLKAANLDYHEPQKPFILFKDTDADKSWQSNVTGNVIALFTDCSVTSDRPLTMAIAEISKGFDRIDNTKQNTVFYNGREAIVAEFKGHIDGIKVSMESLVFNKNKCFYQLTFSGLSNQFERERPNFEDFKKEFKAP